MSINALRDIQWIHTTGGLLTPYEALRRADQLGGLDLSLPAFEVSSQMRILDAVFAMVVYKAGGQIDFHKPLPTQFLDAAIDEIGTAANLDDPRQPFLQQPRVTSPISKETAIEAGSAYPIKKLFPTTPPDQASEFWGLSTPEVSSLPLDRAVLALAVFHHFSPAGNNAYNGQKCSMGSPGLRFPGKDNSATEFLWTGATLLETLALNTPRSFTQQYSLPAWADRTGEQSCSAADEPPLWAATWSSNAPVCVWTSDSLVGVRVGGIPEEWYHAATMGKSKQTRKEWWDLRNTVDPFYFYRIDPKGIPKAQRLDIGKDPTALVVDWLANNKFTELQEKRHGMVREPSNDAKLLFLRHQIGGTASSPSIRASLALVGTQSEWAPSSDIADIVVGLATMMESLHRIITAPFRRFTMGDKQKMSSGRTPIAFDSLTHRRPDASTSFWRHTSSAFTAAFDEINHQGDISDHTMWSIGAAAMRAFDETIEPHIAQLGPLGVYVRGNVERFVNSEIRSHIISED